MSLYPFQNLPLDRKHMEREGNRQEKRFLAPILLFTLIPPDIIRAADQVHQDNNQAASTHF